MPLPPSMIERAASRSPGGFGVSIDQARGPLVFRVADPELEAAVKAVIGEVSRKGDGTLRRTLPLQHPRFAGWYAERISNAQGYGKGLPAFSPTFGFNADNTLDSYGTYDNHDLVVEFLPRPYSLIPDELAGNRYPVTWTDTNGSAVKSWGTFEWTRWCDWDVESAGEMIAAEQGFMFYAADDSVIALIPGVSGPYTAAPPHHYAFPGKPRLPVPKSLLHCYWYNVPYSYWSSSASFLRRFKNRVNVDGFAGYGPGALLYLGAKVAKRYTPYLPDFVAVDNATVVSQDKFADFVLSWEVLEVPIAGHPTDNPPWMFSSPHNCAPWFGDTKWYSVITTAPVTLAAPNAPNDTSKWRTLFPTYPPGVLFTDPDVAPPP